MAKYAVALTYTKNGNPSRGSEQVRIMIDNAIDAAAAKTAALVLVPTVAPHLTIGWTRQTALDTVTQI